MKILNITMREIKDIDDAIQTAIEGDYIKSNSRVDDFSIEKKTLPLSEILNYDDYGSWGQWEKGELKNLDKTELTGELTHFRGKKWAELAKTWIKDNSLISSIVIFPELGLIGDGRGRVSFAVGMKLKTLPVILLT